MWGCSHLPKPPVAEEKPQKLEIHGDVRTDPYFWLKERENPKVIDHLKAENAYVEAVLTPVKGLREKLYLEMRSRIKEDDSSAPFLDGGYYYYSRFETGKEYGNISEIIESDLRKEKGRSWRKGRNSDRCECAGQRA